MIMKIMRNIKQFLNNSSISRCNIFISIIFLLILFLGFIDISFNSFHDIKRGSFALIKELNFDGLFQHIEDNLNFSSIIDNRK